MAENGLPCLDLLEATPGILRGLMTELTEEDARWKPAPERFSVAEVLAHLSHSESHCYRMRLDRFLADPEGALPGTRMGFVGLRDAAERRAVIEYLERATR